MVLLGPIQPVELARSMKLDASTLTRNLQPLIAQGWVEVGPGSDARSRSISATDSGRAKRAEGQRAWKQAQLALNHSWETRVWPSCTTCSTPASTSSRPRRIPQMNDTRIAGGPALPSMAWVLLAAAGTFALTMGARQSMGLFVSTLNTHTGIGLAAVSLAFAFGQLWWGLTQPLAGIVADRVGAGRVLIVGLMLVALGTALTPFMTSTTAA